MMIVEEGNICDCLIAPLTGSWIINHYRVIDMYVNGLGA